MIIHRTLSATLMALACIFVLYGIAGPNTAHNMINPTLHDPLSKPIEAVKHVPHVPHMVIATIEAAQGKIGTRHYLTKQLRLQAYRVELQTHEPRTERPRPFESDDAPWNGGFDKPPQEPKQVAS